MLITNKTSVPAHDTRNQRTINKYLEIYAEPESQWGDKSLSLLADRCWDYVVAIPACGEFEFLPGALESITQCRAVTDNARVLCIVILNGNRARETEYKVSNQDMHDWFSGYCEVKAESLNPPGSCPQTLMRWRDIDILLVERCKEPWLVPADQGVGLVRKIAADIALRLISAGKVASPWIHNTDADARVPDDYFLRLSTTSRDATTNTLLPACFIYPYQHIPDPEMEAKDHQRYWPAVSDYELWLRYYVAGLQWAGSYYAYPSIGSLLACDALAYARTRGFPKKMAGEDFYFQNKLAKVGSMINLKGKPVRLLTRPSSRVPFGTGQGTIKIESLYESGHIYKVYHPAVFDFLKAFLQAVDRWFLTNNAAADERESTFLGSLGQCLPSAGLKGIDAEAWLVDLIQQLDVFNHLRAAENRSKSTQGAMRQFDDWFDGFRTLKLIHRLRDDLYGSLPLLEALQASCFLHQSGQSGGRQMSRDEWLERLRSTEVSMDMDQVKTI